jgi:hypothetical protein
MSEIEQLSATHFRISKVPRLAGYAAETIPAGAIGNAITRCFLHSGEGTFHKVIEEFFALYIGKYFLVDQVGQFLLVIHADLTADVYINDLPVMIQVRAKRAVNAFEAIGNKDIADITELRFVNVELKDNDHIMYCFKRGWMFGLYFDLDPTPGRVLDREQLYRDLGRYFRYLSFYKEYSVIEDNVLFPRLFEDGWFPFMELIGGEFDALADVYRYSDSGRGLMTAFLNRFNKDRLDQILCRWWTKKIFADKRSLLEAGVEAYLANTAGGFINCVKTIQSEIDGVLRLRYFSEKGKRPSFKDLTGYIHEKATARFVTPDALGFPALFYRYLDEIVLREFRLEDGDIAISRHSSLHGVASADQYTKEKALQSILTLDQLCWYLD